MGDRLELIPITLKEAKVFIEKHHRHHKPPVGHIVSVAAAKDDKVVGVAVVGRPVARGLQDGWTAEITRVATDGTRNACSFLLTRAKRVAQALGYRRVITYTLPEEGGASLRAAGFKNVGMSSGGNWNTPSRPRVDTDHQQKKFRWEA